GSRGLATGRFFAQDGTLLATVVQEGLLRVMKR
ncbi:MAG: acyl-CoA thioesterase II, partial [Mycobacteriaceae bacterium]